MDAIAIRHQRDQVLLAGHSLGGTLAAIFAALHPERVAGLLLLEAPLHFSPDAGSLGALAALTPWAPLSGPDSVPGSLLSVLGLVADPIEFMARPHLAALALAADPEGMTTFLRVVRWTLDELAMPGSLFREVVLRLCRYDAFYRGVLTVSGHSARPTALGMPVLAVIDPDSLMVPPASLLPVLKLGSGAREVHLFGEGAPEIAFRHLGCLIGERAHRHLWPDILAWMQATWSESGANEPD
jgi:polyhydroxyalkanoate synthase